MAARLIERHDLTSKTKLPDLTWVPLFNGKDLSGWKVHGGGVGRWKVEDGMIVGSGPPIHLFSERDEYENFHLRAEVMINDGGDSGIFFRAPFWPGVLRGYEAQVNSTNSTLASLTGSLFGFGPAQTVTEMLVKPGEWFTYEVESQGNRVVLEKGKWSNLGGLHG